MNPDFTIAGLIESLALDIQWGFRTRDEAENILRNRLGLTEYGARLQLRAWQTARTRYRDRRVLA